METRRRSPLRILAPIALVAFAVALALVVASANTDDGGGGNSGARDAEKARDLGSTTDDKASARRKRQEAREEKLPDTIYIVKTGDTLGSIAEKTGIPVEKIQELNPELDQFSLRSGQKIKLR
jgi:hypothetical protein